jgi:protein-serine/threonine kinase
MLRDKEHGAEILDVRKALAFAGFTHKSPRVISYVRADKAFDPRPDTYGQARQQHEQLLSGTSSYDGRVRGRAISF